MPCEHKQVKDFRTFDMTEPFFRCEACGEFGVTPGSAGPSVAAPPPPTDDDPDVSPAGPVIVEEVRAFVERATDGTLRIVIPMADIKVGDSG